MGNEGSRENKDGICWSSPKDCDGYSVSQDEAGVTPSVIEGTALAYRSGEGKNGGEDSRELETKSMAYRVDDNDLSKQVLPIVGGEEKKNGLDGKVVSWQAGGGLRMHDRSVQEPKILRNPQ